MTVVAALQPQDIQLIQTQPEQATEKSMKQHQHEMTPVALIKTEGKDDTVDQQQAGGSIATFLPNTTQVQEYLQRIQTSTLPFNLQQFLKFNNDVKREAITEDGVIEAVVEHGEEGQETLIMNDMDAELDNEEVQQDPEGVEQGKGKKKRYFIFCVTLFFSLLTFFICIFTFLIDTRKSSRNRKNQSQVRSI